MKTRNPWKETEVVEGRKRTSGVPGEETEGGDDWEERGF